MRLLLLARHGQSILNVSGLVNGDPRRDKGLSPLGVAEARKLGSQVAGVSIDFCITSEFPRARQTAELALEGRDAVRCEVDGDLDDIRIGELEGRTLADYRTWKRAHTRQDSFPGGESLDASARRYADAYERLLDRTEQTVLCVCHEIPVRYLVNAAAGSDDLDGPLHDIANATPYAFDAAGLSRGVRRMRELVGR
ncbi:MAG: histidine phosphatase family protein [Gaiellaceae bacterium]